MTTDLYLGKCKLQALTPLGIWRQRRDLAERAQQYNVMWSCKWRGFNSAEFFVFGFYDDLTKFLADTAILKA